MFRSRAVLALGVLVAIALGGPARLSRADCISVEAWRWGTGAGTVEIPCYFGYGLVGCSPLNIRCSLCRTAIDLAIDDWNTYAASDLGDAFLLLRAEDLAPCENPGYGIVFMFDDLGVVNCQGSAPSPGLVCTAPTSCSASNPSEPAQGRTYPRDLGSPINDVREARRIDIVINSQNDWNHLDMQTVVLHEIGHALGVGHLYGGKEGLMHNGLACGAQFDIGGPEIEVLKCLYDAGPSVLNCELGFMPLFGVSLTGCYGGPAKAKMSYARCGSLPSSPSPIGASALNYELAMADPGEPYEVFANLTDGDWIDHEYEHQFTRGYNAGQLRMRVFDGATQIGECYASNTVRIDAPPTAVESGKEPAWMTSAPNPFRSQVRLTISLPTRTDLDVSVYDVAGRRLESLLHGPVPAGVQSIVWPGPRGRAGVAGVYYVRARGDGVVLDQAVLKAP